MAHVIDFIFGAVFLIVFWGLVILGIVALTRKLRRK